MNLFLYVIHYTLRKTTGKIKSTPLKFHLNEFSIKKYLHFKTATQILLLKFLCTDKTNKKN